MLTLYRWLTVPAWLLLMTVGRLLPRVRVNIAARRGWAARLARELAALPPAPAVIWIHCASMGEFEAIRPLARRLRTRGLRVVISFFSTSGPRHLPAEVEADLVCYLPFDTPWSARRFVDLIAPDLAVVTKHDLWPNLLLAARRRGARLAFVNANFHDRSRLALPWLRSFHRDLLAGFDWIAAVGPLMADRFQQLLTGCSVPVEATGDSRFDRVLERAQGNRSAELLPAGFRAATLLVAGSTWEPDEEAFLPAVARLRPLVPGGLHLLLVPHEPHAARLEQLERRLAALDLPACRLSTLEQDTWRGQPVIVVDRVGLLAGLYAGADLAWVGGGFTTGVHSVIEPAASGLPVLFGPRHHVSQEAQDLLACGGAAEVTAADADRLLEGLLLEDGKRRGMARAALGLVQARAGVTSRLEEGLLALLGPGGAGPDRERSDPPEAWASY
ncbi:MAG: glycosyltransferase N-terminal domain-containing protein [bacterium]|jgi:3-deoxy-D-manno-octulosonic-acid transferase|nr:glycosyltransferase N-terminal domain-containing protein [bacterium]